MASVPNRPEELLAHDAFVRRIARGLVRDVQAAEDVAQSALAAAWERGPDEPASLRAWLAVAVRRIASKERRGERRRGERELAAARSAATDSVAELVAREALRRRVVEALVELDEPYRSTLALGFYDGLPPRRVAERMNVPVETVRTRTKRGLAMLRARLDREMEGGRAAWCALLVPLALDPLPFLEVARANALEVLAMSTKTKLAAAGAALAGLALVVSLVVIERDAPLEPRDAVEAAALEPRPVEEAVSEHEHSSVESSDARSALASAPTVEPPEEVKAPAEPFGTILLSLVREIDERPAPDMLVRVQPWSATDWPIRAFDVRTDAEGKARIERVPAGRVGLWPLEGGSGRVELAPGSTVEHTIRLPRGFEVNGLVVDSDGDPVAGADVWVSDVGNLDHGMVVMQTEADGTFSLECLDGMRFVAARSSRHAPSRAEMIFGAVGARVSTRLVLGGRCGRVEGRIVDPLGSPVAGAFVRVGSEAGIKAEGFYGLTPPFDLVTDEDGAFLADGVLTGRIPFGVRATGFALVTGDVEVFDAATTRLDLALTEGVSLSGFVRNAAGEPLAGVGVAVGPYGKLGHSTRSAKDGSFRLDGLEVGEIEARADGGDRGRAEVVLHGQAGQELTWDPLLSTGLSLSGRVLGEDGSPLIGWQVMIQSVHERVAGPIGDFHNDGAQTDEEGRFAFLNLRDRDYELEVSAPDALTASLVRRPVRPDGTELVLHVPSERVPSVNVSGRVVGRSGEPLKDVSLSVATGEPSLPIEYPDLATGRFALGPYPAGTLSLIVRVGDGPQQRFGPHELAPGEHWDLGTLEVGGTGSLLVRLRRAAGAPAKPPGFALDYAGNGTRAEFQLDGDRARAAELAPGSYALRVGEFDGFACALHPFEVRADEETVLDVELAAGIARALYIELAQDDASIRFVGLAIERADGARVLSTHLARESEPAWERELRFAPGSYRAEARLEDGRSASASFTVDAAETNPAPVVLRID